ncbi:MAG: MFS transporter [Treponema sp.]|jgi:PPP family 3-phenylpropionic acid transporter|nr:MFS transporter [Treponema sp.]
MANYAVLGVISPFLPILIRTLGYSPSMVGLLMGIYEGAGIVGPFVLGFLVDRWGRYKPGLLISVLLMLLPALPLALIHRPLPSALLLCVLAVGVKSGLPLMEAMTTIVVGKEGNYGKIRSFGSVGFILSVLFLQWFPYLPRNSALNIGIWIAILSSIALVMMCLVPARFTALRQDAAPRPATAPLRIWTPFFTLGLLMIALTRIAMAPVASFISLYVVEYIKWDAVGMIWAIAAAAETPLIFFSRRIIRYFKSPLKVIFLTCFALILRLLIYALFPYPPAIVAAQLLHSLCYGLFHSAAVAFISANIPPERRALGMTIYLSLGTGFPTFLGNILGGFIVEYLGYRALFGSYTIFSLLAMGVYLVIRGAGRTRTGYRAILPP